MDDCGRWSPLDYQEGLCCYIIVLLTWFTLTFPMVSVQYVNSDSFSIWDWVNFPMWDLPSLWFIRVYGKNKNNLCSNQIMRGEYCVTFIIWMLVLPAHIGEPHLACCLMYKPLRNLIFVFKNSFSEFLTVVYIRTWVLSKLIWGSQSLAMCWNSN